MSFARSTLRTARVEHSCAQGACKINIGDRYLCHTYTSDFIGGIVTDAVCSRCEALSRDLYTAGVYSEDEYGNECLPYLSEVELDEVPKDLQGRMRVWLADRGALGR